MPSKIFAKFWGKVDQSGGPDACWPWTGDKHRKGYGRAFVYGFSVPSHRLALTLHSGEPSDDSLHACHTCDNPPCCNPAHLWWGTNSENVRDAISKGRWSNIAKRKIDRDELVALRVQGLSYSQLAKHFSVNQANIGRALKASGYSELMGDKLKARGL